MYTNEILINNVKNWLNENNKTYEWLSDKLKVSRSLVGHMLSGSRTIRPNRIEEISKAINVPVSELVKDSNQSKTLNVQLRGRTANRKSRNELKSLLFSIEDYVALSGRTSNEK